MTDTKSPHKLWAEANGDADRYRELMIEHGHLVPKTRTRFHIGADEWPGISKLVEEAGEVLQICGKLIANEGKAEHWDGTNLRERLAEELPDLEAAIRFVCKHAGFDLGAHFDRRDAKFKIFEQWHQKQRNQCAFPGCEKLAYARYDGIPKCADHCLQNF